MSASQPVERSNRASGHHVGRDLADRVLGAAAVHRHIGKIKIPHAIREERDPPIQGFKQHDLNIGKQHRQHKAGQPGT